MTTTVGEDLYVLPASYGQERLWLLEQISPETALYNVPLAVRLRGRLDAPALAEAVSGLVRRHEVLRTVLQMRDGEVTQVVREALPFDLVAESVDGSEEAVLARIGELAALPFDLAEGPLLRGHLLAVAEDEHVLVLVAHHTVTDGWSLGVMLAEIAALYAAVVGGSDAELPEIPVQYADYALWQREQVDGGSLSGQVDYWRERLRGAPRALALPAGPRAADAPPHASVTAPLRVPAMAVRHLRAIAPGGVTPTMVAMAAHTAVLARWSGQDDVVVASPVAGRGEPELEGMVGFFVNTLPVRVDLSDDPSLTTLMERVRDSSFGAYDNADVPFEVLVGELRPERAAGRLPLAQTMLAVNNTPLPEDLSLPGLTGEPVRLAQSTAVFDVTVDLVEGGDALSGTVGLRADRFDQETADLLAESIGSVLRTWAAAPDTPLSALPCPVAERDDPAAAPVHEAGPEESDGEDTLPATPTEHLLLELWGEELGTPVTSVRDEFYALGGDSMRAVRIVMRARDKGVELPVDMVLGEHTVRQLASATG
ncbi:condensation domain-containing protein [Nocardiopsis sp. FIRDI 009]|uniref:condensation domain-containing protein n=1 Tax=Nocardiopsis sp. FIRDI 009 TaxID=714197 RepID=UPI000E249FFE|nr:condensation domain-containing protein [Nocardiopsis sp. FIRDI 009]